MATTSDVREFLSDLLKLTGDVTENDLLRALSQAYEGQAVSGVNIEKFESNQHVAFHRQAAVFHRQMYNRFFVPVWAAIMGGKEGYIVYPKTTSLRQRLSSIDRTDNQGMINLMRQSFAPVAFALDALHTPIPNHRIMYYHRDVCIDNVYFYQNEQKDYSDALLKLTKQTRGSHEREELDIYASKNNATFPRKYFHHPEPFVDSNYYHRRHDWFSFGVYIVEVIDHVLHETDEVPPIGTLDTVEEYIHLVTELENQVETWQNKDFRRFILQHLSVARACLCTKDGDLEQLLNYDLPQDLQQRFKHLGPRALEPYSFEYGLCKWSAQLLWLYDHFRREERTFLIDRVTPERKLEYVCQACYRLPVAKLPTRTYKRGKDLRCEVSCNFYCTRCYTNRERLFCPDQHGTASAVIGNYASYALILYGDDPSDTFKKDAISIENVLKHKLICGIPDDNVSVCAVFDRRNPGNEQNCLVKACQDMKERIHGRQLVGSDLKKTETCQNDFGYTLFIFYSGHGGQEMPGNQESQSQGGHWYPSIKDGEPVQSHVLRKEVIDEHLKSIRECTSNDQCTIDCIAVTYILDHCNTMADIPPVALELDKQKAPTAVVVTTEPGTKAKAHPKHGSDLTRWFCELMRCKLDDHTRRGESCSICFKLKRRIEEECGNAFIDGKCLELHEEHMDVLELNYKSDTPSVTVRVRSWPHGKKNNPNAIAYYHPKGVHYKVFGYKEEHPLVEVDFRCQITCDQVIEEVRAQRKLSPDTMICLLANLPNDHCKYTFASDNTIRDTLDSSLLFYHIIEKPITVVLATEGMEDIPFQVALTQSDLFLLVNDYNRLYPDPNGSKWVLPHSQLPNIFAHIIHHLRYKEYNNGVISNPDQPESPSTSSGDNEQQYQPSGSREETDINDTERVRTSFIRHLYHDSRDFKRVMDFTAKDWKDAEEKAVQHPKGHSTKVYALTTMEFDFVLRVEWPISSSPLVQLSS